MRSLNVSNTAIDLANQDVPFKTNYTVVIVNATSGALTLQGSDTADFASSVDLAVVPGGNAVQLELSKDFIRASGAGPLIMLGN